MATQNNKSETTNQDESATENSFAEWEVLVKWKTLEEIKEIYGDCDLDNLDIPDIDIEYQEEDDDEVCDGCSI